MRALAVLALIPLLVACSTARPWGSLAENPPTGTDISGHWTGSWVGSGLFNAVRQENVTFDVTQRGDAGYGRLVLDGATAAESVPWEVRQQGLGGIRVFATVSGSKVKLAHELDDRLFSANLTVMGDQMVGQVQGRGVRLVRASPTATPECRAAGRAGGAPDAAVGPGSGRAGDGATGARRGSARSPTAGVSRQATIRGANEETSE